MMMLQGKCLTPIVVDTVLTAFMLNTSELLRNDRSGLCNASVLGRADAKMGELRLRRLNLGRMSPYFVVADDDGLGRQMVSDKGLSEDISNG
jgi:hypothetical protein